MNSKELISKLLKIKYEIKINNRGGLIDKGAVYVVVILTILIFGGYLFVGGTLPTKLPKLNTEYVTVVIPTSYPMGRGLQMHTLVGVSLTPAPTSGIPPTGSPSDPTLVDCNRQIIGRQEQEMIWGFLFDSSPAGGNMQALKVFYTNKYPLILGSGNVSLMNQLPTDNIANPLIGDPNIKDVDNLSLYPALYITDNTANSSAILGDAQAGGRPNKPDFIYGSWKALGAIDPNPSNGQQLGSAADPWPAASIQGPHDLTYTSEIIWKTGNLLARDPFLNQFLPLKAGNKYRVQIILHDGGNPQDVGIVCVQLNLPTDQQPAPPLNPPPPPV